jgi:hypothetical protein
MISHSAELEPESCHDLSKQKISSKHRVKRGEAPELKSEPTSSFSELSSLTYRNSTCGTGKRVQQSLKEEQQA